MDPGAELRLPAETAYVAVLRMTTAGIAARADFTLDDIEDLRIAVGEACAVLLEDADPDGELRATYTIEDDRITVRVATDTATASPPDQDSFAWQVLSALAEKVSSEATDTEHAITLTVTSSAG